jgi:hypothetical protein
MTRGSRFQKENGLEDLGECTRNVKTIKEYMPGECALREEA